MKSHFHALPLLCALATAPLAGTHAAGVVVTKEQSYHRDASAQAIAYRTMLASPGPYLRLLSTQGQVMEVRRSKVVAHLELPDQIPSNLLDEADVRPLRALEKSVADFRSRYPASAPLLERYAASLRGHLARFDEGWVRFEEQWITGAEYAGRVEARRYETATARLMEIEQRIADAARRDQVRVPKDDRWFTPEDAALQPADVTTELSIAISPLRSGDLDGAKRAVENLVTLSAGQDGAAKVHSERLMTAVKNLYAAETQLGQRLILVAGEMRKAAEHERNAKEWLTPNAFGRVNAEAAAASQKDARDIRRRVDREIAMQREELRAQLREIQEVREDFTRLGELRVAEVLEMAARAVNSRNFGPAEAEPTRSPGPHGGRLR